MIKLKTLLHYAAFIIILVLILILIPSSFLPYNISLLKVYYGSWFKWLFGGFFALLSISWVFASAVLKKLGSFITHTGVLLVLFGALLSSRAIRGKVSVKEGDSFDTFSDAKTSYVLPSPIKLMQFNEDGYVNTVLIDGKEYKSAPSHPFCQWGYYFYSYDYDLKWDVNTVTLIDQKGKEYSFGPGKNKQFVSFYVLNFMGLSVNRDNDTLAEFMVFENTEIKGALFVGKNGCLAPTYDLDLSLVKSDFDVSYISTIMIVKDQGLLYVTCGFIICCASFLVIILGKKWMK